MIFLWGNYNDAAPTALKKWGWWDIIPGRCLGLALAAPLGLGILPGPSWIESLLSVLFSCSSCRSRLKRLEMAIFIQAIRNMRFVADNVVV